MTDSFWVLQEIEELKRRVEALEAQVELLTDMGLERSGASVAAGDTFDVMLLSYPQGQKIQTIKVLRELTSLGLADSKAMSEALPCRVLAGVDANRADRAVRALGDIEAVAERRPSG